MNDVWAALRKREHALCILHVMIFKKLMYWKTLTVLISSLEPVFRDLSNFSISWFLFILTFPGFISHLLLFWVSFYFLCIFASLMFPCRFWSRLFVLSCFPLCHVCCNFSVFLFVLDIFSFPLCLVFLVLFIWVLFSVKVVFPFYPSFLLASHLFPFLIKFSSVCEFVLSYFLLYFVSPSSYVLCLVFLLSCFPLSLSCIPTCFHCPRYLVYCLCHPLLIVMFSLITVCCLLSMLSFPLLVLPKFASVP